MPEKNKIVLTLEEKRASRDTQILEKKSALPHSPQVQECEQLLAADPQDPERWMKLGLALAKQMLFVEATAAFSRGLALDPFNWLLLRHRGHRHLSTYRFAEAAADFELASRINPQDWDVWYHLGLSYYLLGDYNKAERAYAACAALTRPEDINVWAIINWRWHALKHLGREQEAAAWLAAADPSLDAGENQPYKDAVLCYLGRLSLDEAMSFDNEEFADLEYSTRGYGLAQYLLYQGKRQEAKDLLQEILRRDKYWSAFGYMGAYQDVNEGRLD